jgi:D-erythronate 2-dehydrogenase
MNVLVTGASGFLGTRLIDALLARDSPFPGLSRVVAADIIDRASADPRVEMRVGSIAEAGFLTSLFNPPPDLIFHLAAVLSGQSEAEFDVGLQVNVDATRALLEACRRLPGPPRFVFTSSVAVFGGELPDVVPEHMATRPESSYGTEKAIGELLVSDYSRRGFVDGIACRLPTIAVRPGRPNSALSSFVSGIIREPLAGIDAVCPVPLSTRLWISSPRTCIHNLLHATRIPAHVLTRRRVVTLPGLCVTAEQMLSSLERLGGAEARARVRCHVDPDILRIVSTWPGAFDVTGALQMGFVSDESIDAILTEFIAHQRG